MIGFSVLALDSCGLGQGEGELSVKELWLDIREKVTEQLSNLLAYMDGKSNAEELIQKALKDPSLLQALSSGGGGGEGGE